MGNCDLWLKFLPWFDRANQVVILPSSFYNIPQLLEKFDERFIIFCRDKKSYHYLKKTKTKATVILGHDLTLQMNLGCYSTELLLRYQEEAYRKEYKDTLSHLLWNLPRNEYRGVFLRQDGESVAHSWNSLQNDMDLPEFVYTDENVTRKFILYYTLLFLSCLDQQQEIVTDRLHVAIACVLMGKNVLMADNASGENFAVYEQSLKHVSNIRKLHPHDVIEKCEESIKRRYKIESVILTA
jgi:exopolysaccharide biosynthesis predicted pyruvyltransferase EpsI